MFVMRITKKFAIALSGLFLLPKTQNCVIFQKDDGMANANRGKSKYSDRPSHHNLNGVGEPIRAVVYPTDHVGTQPHSLVH